MSRAAGTPQVLDEVVVVSRPTLANQPADVSLKPVSALVAKPHPFYVLADESNSSNLCAGSPVFALTGAPLGIKLGRYAVGDERMPTFSETRAMLSIVIPAACISDDVKQVLGGKQPATRASLAPAVGDAVPENSSMAGKILEDNQGAVVTLRIAFTSDVATMGLGKEHDYLTEVVGTVIDPSGLTVFSLTKIAPNSIMRRVITPPQGGAPIIERANTQVKAVTIISSDGSELPAQVVLRDNELDLGFVHPTAPPAKPLLAVDLSKAAGAPQMLNDVVVLSRLGQAGSRIAAVSRQRVLGLATKPRPCYMLSNFFDFYSAHGIGSPVFAMNGTPLGIMAFRRTLTELQIQMYDFTVEEDVPVVIPAAAILAVARQVMPVRQPATHQDKDVPALAAAARASTKDSAVAASKVLSQYQNAVVRVGFVQKGELLSSHFESEYETVGLVVDPSGLTVVPLTGMARKTPGGGNSSPMEIINLKILCADGTELPATLVMRDEERNLAFVRPTTKPAQPLPAVDMSKAAGTPQVLDEVVCLNRFGPFAGRAAAASVERVLGVMTKPRLHYKIPYRKVFSPVFALSGEPLGIRCIFQEVIPAADILKDVKQALAVEKPMAPGTK